MSSNPVLRLALVLVASAVIGSAAAQPKPDHPEHPPQQQQHQAPPNSAGVLRQFQRATAAVMERQLALIALLAHPVPAERRLAAFLHNWLLRLRRVGLAGREGREMLLRMRRAEIASLLGLSLETVSRCFTRLQAEGLIEVENRHVTVLDEPILARLAGRSGTPG